MTESELVICEMAQSCPECGADQNAWCEHYIKRMFWLADRIKARKYALDQESANLESALEQLAFFAGRKQQGNGAMA